MVDPYRVLGVKSGADHSQIHKAYRRAARRDHPDTKIAADPATVEASRRRMAAVNAAWAILGDPARRAAYDTEARNDAAITPARPAHPEGGPDPFRAHSGDTLFDGLGDDDLYEPGRPIDVLAMLPVLVLICAVVLFVMSNLIGSDLMWTVSLAMLPLAGAGFVAAPLLAMRRSQKGMRR